MIYASLIDVLGGSRMSQARAIRALKDAYPDGLPVTVFVKFRESLPDIAPGIGSYTNEEKNVLANLKERYGTDDPDALQRIIESGRRPMEG